MGNHTGASHPSSQRPPLHCVWIILSIHDGAAGASNPGATLLWAITRSLEDRAPVDFIHGWPVDRWAPGARSHYRTPGTVALAMAAWWHAPLVKTDGHNKLKQNSDNTKEKMSFHKRPFIFITSHGEYMLFSPANHLFSRQICIILTLG